MNTTTVRMCLPLADRQPWQKWNCATSCSVQLCSTRLHCGLLLDADACRASQQHQAMHAAMHANTDLPTSTLHSHCTQTTPPAARWGSCLLVLLQAAGSVEHAFAAALKLSGRSWTVKASGGRSLRASLAAAPPPTVAAMALGILLHLCNSCHSRSCHSLQAMPDAG
jgi:hypothetical protein